jgi:thioredoxin 1
MVEHLTVESFKEKVFDFTASQDWKYKGDKPAIIDFYADWCGPCKAVAPILEELATEYDGKVEIFKIDTEKEQELAAMFGIRSIPSLLFVPVDGEPQMVAGALPRPGFEKALKDIFKL